MTKIKKSDPRSAQSVFAFACPCLGVCDCGYCYCHGSTDTVHQAAHNSTANAITYEIPGMQTVNYN